MDARDRWNERYAQGGRQWMPETPSEWLVDHAELLIGGGRALDVACGDGRNALYLAHLGYTVDAIDVSDVAIAALRAATASRGLTMTIEPRVAGVASSGSSDWRSRSPAVASRIRYAPPRNEVRISRYGRMKDNSTPRLASTVATSRVPRLTGRVTAGSMPRAISRSMPTWLP
ncbi:MAG: methyltransferase domain-containing protein [Proteobacteria bacterium]|nr:methyltransferase domain-containing protein [Pseudomonadota bacterium]